MLLVVISRKNLVHIFFFHEKFFSKFFLDVVMVGGYHLLGLFDSMNNLAFCVIVHNIGI
ncbi:Uncharacterised protein [Segatella copri]|nr:Uncharacterised protein [Segatella copri]